ncbi:hypothetical protein [Leptospira borgpetersenii]|uniref:hypothetical protein n=1 Tax=Leptospira borgpetersenii TaxID=174 RepID=UPI00051941EA|nr:hypothetical protein [Leptospira borgpetersenii]
MQHGLNEEIGIYEKIEMLRCRLKRRARSSLCKQRLDSPYCPFRGLRADELASLVLDRGQKETGELLHHGFRMQFTETKKQTALAKRTAFRRKAYCPPSSVVCPLKW